MRLPPWPRSLTIAETAWRPSGLARTGSPPSPPIVDSLSLIEDAEKTKGKNRRSFGVSPLQQLPLELCIIEYLMGHMSARGYARLKDGGGVLALTYQTLASC